MSIPGGFLGLHSPAAPLVKPLTASSPVAYGVGMKHVTYGEKSLLMGDVAADTLLEYAALVASLGTADTVKLRAFGSDGQEVVATLLLEQGAPLMAESSHTSMVEPDNAEALEYMRKKIMLMSSPPPAMPADATMPSNYEDLDLPDHMDP
jgi:hypothetical protein